MRFLLAIVLAGCGQLFGLQEVKLDADAAVDAFDPQTHCLPGYDHPFGDSRYRILTLALPALAQHDICRDDLAGVTHLAVISSPSEQSHLMQLVNAQPGQRAYVGLVQSRAAAEVNQYWLSVTGEQQGWVWGPNEPDDVDMIEIDHYEQFAMFLGATGLVDYDGDINIPALCECDGRGISEEARTAIDVYR